MKSVVTDIRPNGRPSEEKRKHNKEKRKANQITKSAPKWGVGVMYLKKHLHSRIMGAGLQKTSGSSAAQSA